MDTLLPIVYFFFFFYNNLVLDIEQTGNLQTINIGKEGNPSPPPSLSD